MGNIEVGENVGGSAAGECRMSCTGSAMSLNATRPLEMFPNGTLALTPTANGAAGLSAIQVVSMQHWSGGGRFELDFSRYTPSVGDAWEIIHYSGSVNAFAASVDAPAGFTAIEDQSIPGVIRLEVTGVPTLGSAYCFCDGSGTASPCLNGGTAGRGCANGTDASGAELTGSGVASVGADTLLLSVSGLPVGQPGLFFQGNNAVNGGLGSVFGDGLRCAGSSVIRPGVATSSGTGTSDTSGMAQPISVKGVVNPGDVRRYQLCYRDPVGSPCGNNFNLTNGYEVQW